MILPPDTPDRLPHTCGFHYRVRELPRPDICAECERQTHKDADGFVRNSNEQRTETPNAD
jgi:hypothetical protein